MGNSNSGDPKNEGAQDVTPDQYKEAVKHHMKKQYQSDPKAFEDKWGTADKDSSNDKQ